jgi:hypothetical protein
MISHLMNVRNGMLLRKGLVQFMHYNYAPHMGMSIVLIDTLIVLSHHPWAFSLHCQRQQMAL